MTDDVDVARCPECDDGNGGCVYPYYGVAPHKCGWRFGKLVIGHSEELPKEEWPANYQHDGEPNPGGYPGNGGYTHCLTCGKGAAAIRAQPESKA